MLAALLAALLALVPAAETGSPPNGRIVESLTVTYYDIHGRTPREISDSLQRQGMFLAETGTSFYLSAAFEPAPEGCVLGPLHVSLDITQRMPRWVDEDRARRGVRDQWRRFLRNLQTHEDGHAELGRRTAQGLLRALDRLGPAPDCGVLRAQTEEILAAIRTQMREAHREYDRQTGHGRRQGATFPPPR